MTTLELFERAIELSLWQREQLQKEAVEPPERDVSGVDIRLLQTLAMQAQLIAIGAFSIFESLVQAEFGLENPFEEIPEILARQEETNLLVRFRQFKDAVNVLKHGAGRSYDRLLKEKDELPFRVKGQDENFFDEGDVAEPPTLIYADDAFIADCRDLLLAIHAALMPKCESATRSA